MSQEKLKSSLVFNEGAPTDNTEMGPNFHRHGAPTHHGRSKERLTRLPWTKLFIPAVLVVLIVGSWCAMNFWVKDDQDDAGNDPVVDPPWVKNASQPLLLSYKVWLCPCRSSFMICDNAPLSLPPPSPLPFPCSLAISLCLSLSVSRPPPRRSSTTLLLGRRTHGEESIRICFTTPKTICRVLRSLASRSIDSRSYFRTSLPRLTAKESKCLSLPSKMGPYHLGPRRSPQTTPSCLLPEKPICQKASSWTLKRPFSLRSPT